MLDLSTAQLQEIKAILASHAVGQGVLAFGSRVCKNDSPPNVKPFADLDLALTGKNLPPADTPRRHPAGSAPPPRAGRH